MMQRLYLFRATCRGCGRTVEQRVPASPETVEEGARISCVDCETTNFCQADRQEHAPGVSG